MGRIRTAAAVVLLTSWVGLTACVPSPTPAGKDASPDPSAGSSTGSTAAPAPAATWQDEMLGRVNAQRAALGVAPLALCPRLVLAAQLHSQDQAATNTMSHTGSNGSSLTDRMAAIGYSGWTALGENVAAGYGSVDSVMTGWMGSPGHRANIVSSNFTHVGFGRADATRGTPYWTQNFGRNGTC